MNHFIHSRTQTHPSTSSSTQHFATPTRTTNMPPQRVIVEKAGPPRSRQPKGYFQATYDSLTSPENASVIRSIAIFGVSVAILASPWGEFLLPPQ